MIISIASGKGGTGKTTVVASLAALAKSKVMVDCDVDARGTRETRCRN